MRSYQLILLSIFCFFLVAAGSNVYGQATGTMLGTVTDASGAELPGAKVTVLSQDTGVAREVQTDASGEYRVPFLLVGHYTIKVSYTGFQEAVQKDITLQVDENHEVDFKLNPATVHQQVEVTATPVAVNTTNPTLGQVITSQQVAQLPLNGRDFVQLATLTPGTVKETNPNSFFNGGASSEVSIRGSFSLSVGGSRANSTDWLYDGVDNNELTAGGIAILPSIDAIQEFKVLTYNYSAEYGTRGGPTVLLTTKSGTNQFHGTLFEFLRNTALDARDFFDVNRFQFNENEFGGSLGGPIKKDKTFFFVDYQGRYLRQGLTTVGTVPTLAMRQGDFTEPFVGQAPGSLYNPFASGGFPGNTPFMCDGSGNPLPTNSAGIQPAGTPCNRIPPSLINPIAQKLINLYPAPNVPGTLVGDYRAAPAKSLDEGEWDARLDHNFSTKDSIFARFSYDQATEFLPSGLPGFIGQPGGFSSTQSLADHSRNAALSETHIFSPNSINQVTLGFNRDFNHILSYGTDSCESQKLGIPGANLGGVSCGLTDVSLGSTFWAIGDRGFAPFQGGTSVYSIKDSFDAIRGNHDIKIGGEVRANQMNVLASGFQDGFWVFAPVFTALNGVTGGNIMADFLLGLPVFSEHDQTFEGPVTGRRWKLFRPYIQDDWRVSPNLTLNLGVAWPFVTPITESHNRESNFNFQTGRFLVAGQNGVGPAVGLSTYTGALEPRIGLAWSPFSDRKTSIRAGYAIFHDSSWNQGGQGLWENPPFFGSVLPPFGS
ncbi:MAG: carboxypeptidase regulatory-like domain-containing protein, partial [Terriglobia bacterium]